jgi:transposase-like protein
MTSELDTILMELSDTRGIPLKVIAGEIGVTPMTLYRWRTGQTAPKSKLFLQALENYLRKQQ